MMRKTQLKPLFPGANSDKGRRRIYLFLFAFVIVLGLFTTFVVGRLLLISKYNEVEFTMSLIVKNIEMRLDSAKAITELAAKMPAVAEHDSVAAEQYLNGIIRENETMWSHFLITDQNGIETAHTEGSIHYGKSLAERDYYLVPWNEKKTIVAQPIHSVSTGRKIIAIGVPTYNDGVSNGVLVGFIHLEYVSDLLNANHFSPNSYLFMTNSDGTISAHAKEEYVLAKSVDEITTDAAVLSKIKGLECVIEIGRVEGRLGLVASAPIEQYNLSITSFIPIYEALMAPIIVVSVLLAIFGAVLLLLTFWVKMEKSVAFGKRMENTANTDKLTGLKNRHWLDAMTLDSCCNEFLTVIFLDIDDFKRYNDEHDHAYGDAVLKFVGEALIHSTRPSSDTCIRYAGDEFVILLQDTPIVNVVPIAERLMSSLKNYRTAVQDEPIYISCGITCAKKGELSLEELIAKADNAAYKAKRSGKNSIFVEQ